MNEKYNIAPDFLVELKKGSAQAIKTVYEQAYPICANLISNNSGTTDDCKDIFQEALLVLIQKLKKSDFVLSASVRTYMYAIVRNLWLKQLRNQGKKGLLLVLDEPEIGLELVEEEEYENKQEMEGKYLQIEQAMDKISEDCRRIITGYYFQKLSLKEIAEWLGYTDNFVKVKKKRCMDALKEKVFEQEPKA